MWDGKPSVLWKLVFPGIYNFTEERERRNHYLEFINYANTDGCSVNILLVKKNEKWRNGNGFSSSNYRSRIKYNKTLSQRLSLSDDLTSTRVSEAGGSEAQSLIFNGLSKKADGHFCGQMNMKYAIENFIKGGELEAQKVVKNNIVVAIDPGNINIGVCAFFVGNNNHEKSKIKGRVQTLDFKANCRYTQTGLVDDMLDYKIAGDSSKIPGFRTSNLDDLKEATEAAKPFILAARELERQQNKRKRKAKGQAYFHGICNQILAQVNCLVLKEYQDHERKIFKTPVILFGNGNFKSGKLKKKKSLKIKYINRWFWAQMLRL